MALIQASAISEGAVYGIPQMEYTVDGKEHQDFGSALAVASLRQAKSLETEADAVSSMVHVRMRKLEDLGQALSDIAEYEASLPPKDGESSDRVYNSKMKATSDLLAKYGVNFTVYHHDEKGWYSTREKIQYARPDVQFALDREDNDLQQDMIGLQSLMSKRDNAFSTASKLLNKFNSASKKIINNFGS